MKVNAKIPSIEELDRMKEVAENLIKMSSEFIDIVYEYKDTILRPSTMIHLEVYKKYGMENIQDVYGDMFYIIGKHDGCTIGRRVLLNLELSEELYLIDNEIICDSDGQYDHTEYYVTIYDEGETK